MLYDVRNDQHQATSCSKLLQLPGRDVHRSSTSGAVASTSGRFDAHNLSQLKQRVASLRSEKDKVVRSQRAIDEAEGAALLEQRQAHETVVRQLEGQVAALQHQALKQNDRSAKLRAAHDRDKKQLQAQVDQLQQTLDTIHAQHAAKLQQAQQAHIEELQQVQADLQAAHTGAHQQLQEARQQHAAALEDVDQWCSGEVEAVRHVAQQAAARMQQQIDHWQALHEQQCETSRRAQHEAEHAKAAAQQAHQISTDLTKQLAETKEALELVQQQAVQSAQDAAGQHTVDMQQASQQHQEHVQELKHKHAQQLDLINSKLQGVLFRKDQVIAALRQDLAAVQEQLQSLENLLHGSGQQPGACP